MILVDGDDRDAEVVEEICGYLTSPSPRSFFLFAGAGSGKTYTLTEVLKRLTGTLPNHMTGLQYARRLRAHGQSIRVITYTKNAVAEVEGRLPATDLVRVSTIHAFAWELIRGFDTDIRELLLAARKESLAKATADAKGRKRGPTAKDQQTMLRLVERMDAIRATPRFTYNPDRNSYGEGALQHADVIEVASALLTKNATMRAILADRHPLVLIDESQDTMTRVLAALLAVECSPDAGLTLGLLGDHRQRIYLDGHRDLPSIVPERWARPALRTNRRSQRRIVELINQIWTAKLPGRTQQPIGGLQRELSKHNGGAVRLYVGASNLPGDAKIAAEHRIAEHMARVTGAPGWTDARNGFRMLTLEHKLAARRAGFLDVYVPLETIDLDGVRAAGDDRDGSDGGPAAIRVLMREVPALVACLRGGAIDEFAAVEVLRRFGRLDGLPTDANAQMERLQHVGAAVRAFAERFAKGEPTIHEVLETVRVYGLFQLHERLERALDDTADPSPPEAGGDPQPATTAETDAWTAFFAARWGSLMRYRDYLAGRLGLGTHQGVKGSEFDHVLVIMDDEDAGGNSFSYDKLFGGAALSDTDRNNAAEGKETAVDRTLRLLYVTASRAKESLALVYWSADPAAAIERIRANAWFEANEIVDIATL